MSLISIEDSVVRVGSTSLQADCILIGDIGHAALTILAVGKQATDGAWLVSPGFG
jgi:hypothetical protein